MLGRLFGKKKAMKPQSFKEAKEALLESISEESQNKNVERTFADCIEFIPDNESEEVKSLAESIFTLIDTLPIAQASIAFSVCASLVERGYRNEAFIDKIVDLFSQYLKESKPFFEYLDREVKRGEEGESDVAFDVDSLYYELLKDRDITSEKVGESVVKVQYFSPYLTSILSVESSYIEKHKTKLKDDVSFVKDYSTGCYWLDRLLDVFFDEPILVIDVDNHVGFEGKMSGVSDNYQLQYFLMSLPELNKQSAISEMQLSVVNGTGIHVSNSMIDCKWNMYNREICDQEDWEDIKIGPAMTHELKDFWIWGEGSPLEISVHDGRRVILLGRSSYKRTTKLQRTFKNMKASVEVEKVLTDEEINTWLKIRS